MEIYSLISSISQENKRTNKKSGITVTVKDKSSDGKLALVELNGESFEVKLSKENQNIAVGDTLSISVKELLESEINKSSADKNESNFTQSNENKFLLSLLEIASSSKDNVSKNDFETIIKLFKVLPKDLQEKIVNSDIRSKGSVRDVLYKLLDETIDYPKLSTLQKKVVVEALNRLIDFETQIPQKITENLKDGVIINAIVLSDNESQSLLNKQELSPKENIFNKDITKLLLNITKKEPLFILDKEIMLRNSINKDAIGKIDNKILGVSSSSNSTLSEKNDDLIPINYSNGTKNTVREQPKLSELEVSVNDRDTVKAINPKLFLSSNVKNLIAEKLKSLPTLSKTIGNIDELVKGVTIGNSVETNEFNQLNRILEKLSPNVLESSFVTSTTTLLVQSIIGGQDSAIIDKIKEQLEPIETVIEPFLELNRVVSNANKSLKKDKNLLSLLKMVNKNIETLLSDNLLSKGNLPTDELSKKWGLLFENSIKRWIIDNEKPSNDTLKEQLLKIRNLTTKKLISLSLKNDQNSTELKSTYRYVDSSVKRMLSTVEGFQLISQKQEVQKENIQTLWVPVNINGEYTRLGISVKREKNSNNRGGNKLGNSVSITMDLKKLGHIDSSLSLNSNKQLNVEISSDKLEAQKLFYKEKDVLYGTLEGIEDITSIILSIVNKDKHLDNKRVRDTFRGQG